MKIQDWLKTTAHRLGQAGVLSDRLDCLLLLEQVIGQDRTWLLAHPETVLSSVQLRKLNSLVVRRVKREPLAYILGRVEFYGLTPEVNPQVLIPRPETETLVELVGKHAPQKAKVLEVGSGSGAIALALAHTRPDLQILATDISASALEVARRNARKYRMDDIVFQQADLIHDIKGSFSVIVANLPYVPRGRAVEPELGYEPASALFSGSDGLETYRKLFKQIPGHLEPGGMLAIEAEPAQHPDLIELGAEYGLRLVDQEGFALLFRQK